MFLHQGMRPLFDVVGGARQAAGKACLASKLPVSASVHATACLLAHGILGWLCKVAVVHSDSLMELPATHHSSGEPCETMCMHGTGVATDPSPALPAP